MPVVAYIGIGSNLGDSRELIRKAVALLVEKVSAVRTSSLYRTEPVGYEQQEDFLSESSFWRRSRR
jgi:2-amino-4-hydroxy-6-hydroxymethyldihydropteridine diphosphokinase